MLTGADVGSTIRSEVTASNDAGSATAHSVTGGQVDPVAPGQHGPARRSPASPATARP